MTEKRLETVNFSNDEIAYIIQDLDLYQPPWS